MLPIAASSVTLTHHSFDFPHFLSSSSSLSLQVKAKEKEVRLLVLGLDNAGKTTVVKTICGQPTDQIEPTLGFDIQTLEHSGYCLNLWDVGGQKSIRAYWRNYFESTDGLLWVVDSADRVRLELCRQELLQLLQQDKLAGASLLVLANKQDMAGALRVDEIAKVLGMTTPNTASQGGQEGEEQNSVFDKRHWCILPCSAVTGEGLVEGMDWIVEDIGKRIFMLS